ncbi:MAG TPA: hypothetical protein VGY58_15585 [Gemmataceae bacterium]|jgi:hypothetical protein|nr:hypothetical protein [Gemmataceae bacterium]
MKRVLLYVFLCGFCLLASQAFVSTGRADDAQSKKGSQKKDEEKSRDKNTEGVKRSQTSGSTAVTGKITKVDDTTMSLQVTGRNVKLDDILIAVDVKVRMPAEPEFDSKGKPKPFKPDPNDPDRKLGGVKGSKDDLREGQKVVVKVGKHKKDLVATVIVVLPEEKK